MGIVSFLLLRVGRVLAIEIFDPATRTRRRPHRHDFFSHSWRTAPRQMGGAAALPERAGGGRGDGRELFLWAVLEDSKVVPRLLVIKGPDYYFSGMPALVGLCSGVIFLINWQRVRKRVLRSRSALLLPRQGLHRSG